jgi:hypothetical protein
MCATTLEVSATCANFVGVDHHGYSTKDFLTTKVLARQSRNRRFGISPAKNAKAAKKIVIRTWRSSRVGGRNLESEMFCLVIKISRGAQILKHK